MLNVSWNQRKSICCLQSHLHHITLYRAHIAHRRPAIIVKIYHNFSLPSSSHSFCIFSLWVKWKVVVAMLVLLQPKGKMRFFGVIQIGHTRCTSLQLTCAHEWSDKQFSNLVSVLICGSERNLIEIHPLHEQMTNEMDGWTYEKNLKFHCNRASQMSGRFLFSGHQNEKYNANSMVCLAATTYAEYVFTGFARSGKATTLRSPKL